VGGIPGHAVIDAGPARQDTYSAAAERRFAHVLAPATPGLFTRFALDHAAQRPGWTIAVMQAGCTTAGRELDLAALAASGHAVDVYLVDDDIPATRGAVAAAPGLGSATLGELRLIPLKPRSFDIVHCPLLLHRIGNAEVVLGRLAAAVRPGGLLLLRIADPASAAGFLDRRMPQVIRALAWRSTRPGQPGPYPARYEPVASARGIEAFVSRHGLAVAHRDMVGSGGRPARHGRSVRPAGGGQFRAVGKLVAWISRGRLPCDHDELRYVIRKPEDSFARVLR
jgi:SAM-dependent methyltransferase